MRQLPLGSDGILYKRTKVPEIPHPECIMHLRNSEARTHSRNNTDGIDPTASNHSLESEAYGDEGAQHIGGTSCDAPEPL